MSGVYGELPKPRTEPRKAQPRWPWWVAVVAAVAAGAIGVGAGIASQQATISEASAEIQLKQDSNENLHQQLQSTTDQVVALKSQAGDLAQREAAVKAREAAVAVTEQQQAKQEMADGMYIVGTTVDPGVYTTAGPSGGTACYYVWKTGTNADAEIIDNNLVNGPATATLEPGQVFETSRCQKWTKVG